MESVERGSTMFNDGMEQGHYKFMRIDRSRFQEWAEAISDDEELEDEHKALALRLLADYSDSEGDENVVVEFSDPLSVECVARQVALIHLRVCNYVNVVWKRASPHREIWGLQIGYETWISEEGEAS